MPEGEPRPLVGQRRRDPLAALLHRASGETDDRELGQSLGDIDLHGDLAAVGPCDLLHDIEAETQAVRCVVIGGPLEGPEDPHLARAHRRQRLPAPRAGGAPRRPRCAPSRARGGTSGLPGTTRLPPLPTSPLVCRSASGRSARARRVLRAVFATGPAKLISWIRIGAGKVIQFLAFLLRAEGAAGLLIGILSWPDVPWTLIQWVGIALMAIVPPLLGIGFLVLVWQIVATNNETFPSPAVSGALTMSRRPKRKWPGR